MFKSIRSSKRRIPASFHENERVRDGMYGKLDSILNSDFPHQAGDVRLHGALGNAERRANFLIGSARNQHLEYFFFALGKGLSARGKDTSRRVADTFNEQ